MPEFSESEIRFGIFIGLFLLLAVSEFYSPRRKLNYSKPKRWVTNWAIVILDTLVLRLSQVWLAVAAAEWASNNQFGLFNTLSISGVISGIIGFIILDFAIWAAHLASHKVPILWKVHRMHHSDVDIDVTTAIRFHPIEIVLSMIFKVLIVIAFGIPAMAVIIFEVVLNGAAMFNHSNLKIPISIDRWLRWIIVTPDMHRVHHSIVHNETDSNYGFNLPIWDRLFGTYIDQPQAGHTDMDIGLKEWQDERPTRLGWSLKIPFLRKH